jgi:DNA-binding MarR family transcriptional regulator
LQTIRDKGQVTTGELANEISLSQATITTILNRLDKRELVYRERSAQDKRKVHAYLTDRGTETFKVAPAPLQEHFVRQFNDTELRADDDYCISAARRMDAHLIDASPVLQLPP